MHQENTLYRQCMEQKLPLNLYSAKKVLEGCPGTICRARMTLNFDFPEWKFQLALLLIKENSNAKLFLNSYKYILKL